MGPWIPSSVQGVAEVSGQPVSLRCDQEPAPQFSFSSRILGLDPLDSAIQCWFGLSCLSVYFRILMQPGRLPGLTTDGGSQNPV